MGQLTAEAWNASVPVVAMRPCEVDAAHALDRLALVGFGRVGVVAEEVGHLLNGAVIVGLVACTE